MCNGYISSYYLQYVFFSLASFKTLSFIHISVHKKYKIHKQVQEVFISLNVQSNHVDYLHTTASISS
jgi:hypothetical protein